jgi:Right handed beta helix region
MNRFRRRALAGIAVCCSIGLALAFDVHVDADSMAVDPDGSANKPFATIQEGIDFAINFPAPGANILVREGTYTENVVVDSFDLHLVGVDGPALTVIDGGGVGRPILLSNAGVSSVTGFTITGGVSELGGGVEILGGTPTLSQNVITGNSAVLSVGGYNGFGGGVDVYQATVTLVNNLIYGNHADTLGGGVSLDASSSSVAGFNTVAGNTVGTGSGGWGSGIFLRASSFIVLRNNIVALNSGDPGSGGMELVAVFSTTLEGNILFGNTPNNYVEDGIASAPPVGNPVADPRFVDAASMDYQILQDSPAVDGWVNAPPFTGDDVACTNLTPGFEDCNPRPVDGDESAVAQHDVGCFENLGRLSGLTVTGTGTISWSAAFLPASTYNLYRSSRTGLLLGDAGACRASGLASPTFVETDVPALGEVFTFSPSFAHNGAESSLGLTGDGIARQSTGYCP